MVSIHPYVQMHAFTSVCILKIPQSMSEFRGLRKTKAPSMHCRLGSMIVSQLAFPREGNPDFPWQKSHQDNTVVKTTTTTHKKV